MDKETIESFDTEELIKYLQDNKISASACEAFRSKNS